MTTSNMIISLSGQSSSGKSTMENMLVKMFPKKIDKVVSHTTRPKRFNEVDGVDYHFVTIEEFDAIEMMETVSFNGNKYGASKQEFQRIFDSGKFPVIVVTPDGAKQISEKCEKYNWELFRIFLDCPDKLLVERIFERFYRDILPSNDSNNSEKVYNSYLQRINNMFDEEKTWKEFCEWSIVYDEFTKDNENSVVQDLINRLELNTL